ncbi:EscU/YscU/HrcU family type III secretion system export apparatus switch protein [Alicyclobacillus tolerans]|uniref:EscU/YscU/HrcU family type III secretion system export apparatus switch protein n=1 Tax=Alicyclobacillus tolerans TaxID=90970 RepID=UPI001EFF6770|nr:EscU/YscU/HrcU family type III secretion system export apparatus switch protein [Alicyclobacillus tolerans]MCF8564736.1 EscU/YscU/HrcU family type III secretion system export apparatus switch protein [Alicyclobacillus tolerans]
MPTKKAVALRYEQQYDKAPRVVAKGAGAVAEAILKKASESHVSIHEDRDLVDALMNLELDSVIPNELYAVVAEVLAFVYRAKSQSEHG